MKLRTHLTTKTKMRADTTARKTKMRGRVAEGLRLRRINKSIQRTSSNQRTSQPWKEEEEEKVMYLRKKTAHEPMRRMSSLKAKEINMPSQVTSHCRSFKRRPNTPSWTWGKVSTMTTSWLLYRIIIISTIMMMTGIMTMMKITTNLRQGDHEDRAEEGRGGEE